MIRCISHMMLPFREGISQSEDGPTFMRGNIVKITLENFTAYSSIVLTPGPKLTLVLGPNSAGKSSIVSAIVLCLGGTPKDFGREVQVREFIKHGAKIARIEVELFNPDGENYIICCTLTHTQSTWTINGSSGTLADLQNLTKSLNIQVDNLCQILPQEKVLDFFQMNPQMLLKNTELTVGPADVHEHHQKLIQLTRKVQKIESELNEVKTNLGKQQHESDELKLKIAQKEERKTLLKLIEELKIKHKWLMYHHRKKELESFKTELEEARMNLQECRVVERALISKKAKAEREVAITRHEMNYSASLLTRNSSLIDDKHSDIYSAHNSINQINLHLKSLVAFEIKKHQDIESLQSVIQVLENDHSLAQSDESVYREMEDCKRKIVSLRESLTECEVNFASYEIKLQCIEHEIEAQRAVREQATNFKKRREEILFRAAPDVYKGLKWLQENKLIFSGNVFEPMLLEINVPNREHQMYFESVIPNKDMLAFTCEKVSDARLLISKLRDDMGLKINVLHSSEEHPPSSFYKPAQPIESMKEYGFYAYMKDLFTAPEAIKKYLCRRLNIHNIPIGSDLTNKRCGDVPLTCRSFFSNDMRYNVRVSKYTHEKCISANSLVNRNILNNSVDLGLLQKTEESLQQLDHQKESLKQEMSNLKEQKEIIERSLNDVKDTKRKLESIVEKREIVRIRITMKNRNLNWLVEDMETIQREKNDAKTKLQSACQELPELLDKCHETLKAHSDLIEKSGRLEFVMIDARRAASSAKSELENWRYQHAGLLKKVEAMEENYNRLKNLTEVALKNAKELDPNYKLNSEVDVLEEVEKKLNASLAKVTRMAHVNVDILQQYENLSNEIANSKEAIECHCREIITLKEEISNLKDQWFPLVNDLVQRIDRNFGKFLSDVNCAGEVILSPDSDPNDFENYGIEMIVKFQEDGGDMYFRDKFMQSGGEKAVATAVYLIAMQELITAPFRFVDDINQGMDLVNECRVFNILVNAVRSNNSQYLLLSSTLLPEMYSEEMDILFIYCGISSKLSSQNIDGEECKSNLTTNTDISQYLELYQNTQGRK